MARRPADGSVNEVGDLDDSFRVVEILFVPALHGVLASAFHAPADRDVVQAQPGGGRPGRSR